MRRKTREAERKPRKGNWTWLNTNLDPEATATGLAEAGLVSGPDEVKGHWMIWLKPPRNAMLQLFAKGKVQIQWGKEWSDELEAIELLSKHGVTNDHSPPRLERDSVTLYHPQMLLDLRDMWANAFTDSCNLTSALQIMMHDMATWRDSAILPVYIDPGVLETLRDNIALHRRQNPYAPIAELIIKVIDPNRAKKWAKSPATNKSGGPLDQRLELAGTTLGQTFSRWKPGERN